MANFKIVVSDPEVRRSYQTEADQDSAISLVGRKINDEIDGGFLGMRNYVLKITGGSDRDGFPMHPSVQGQAKKRILLTQPPGFHPPTKGCRKRKSVRGNTISESIVQVNVKVVKKGETPLDQIFGKKGASPEEKKVETGGEGSTETKAN